jgi:hypothetical protein
MRIRVTENHRFAKGEAIQAFHPYSHAQRASTDEMRVGRAKRAGCGCWAGAGAVYL